MVIYLIWRWISRRLAARRQRLQLAAELKQLIDAKQEQQKQELIAVIDALMREARGELILPPPKPSGHLFRPYKYWFEAGYDDDKHSLDD